MTSRVLVGRLSIALALAWALAPGAACAQAPIAAPPCEPLVDELRESYDSADAEERLAHVRWLRSRWTPAAFQVLRRASRDPDPRVASEGLLGLAEIAPEYELDGFQMRHLAPADRAALVRRASAEGLISAVALRAIATDSGAEPLERAEALVALSEAEEAHRPVLWLPLLGARDEYVQLLAAVHVLTDAPRERRVAVAQDHARSIVRQAVRDASRGKVGAAPRVLADLRRSHAEAGAEWAHALLVVRGEGDDFRELRAEAARTLVTLEPEWSGLDLLWAELADAPGRSAWALEAAWSLARRGERVPAWLGEGLGSDSAGRVIRALGTGPGDVGGALAELIAGGSPAERAIGMRILRGLPEHQRAGAVALLLRSGRAAELKEAEVLRLTRELASADPIGALAILGNAETAPGVARGLVLAGVWAAGRSEDSELGLLRAVVLAEREVEGAFTAERADLAERLELVIARPSVFKHELRAEAAWLALVLRDQGSLAMAHLTGLSPVYDADLSLEVERADSLLQWAQMPYP